MKLHKVIRKRFDKSIEGISAAGRLNAVIRANVNEPGTTRTDVRAKSTVVQRSGRVGQASTEPNRNNEEEIA